MQTKSTLMQLGISSYTFGWAVQAGNLDEQDLLEKARELDVSLVQFGDNLPLHELSELRLEALARRAQNEGITIETGARGLTLPHLQKYIEISRRLNAKLLRFVVDDGAYRPAPHEVIAVLREAAPSLENLKIGLENHDRFASSTLRKIVDEAGSDNIGICLDTANSLGAGEGLNEVLFHLAPVTLNLHIKDFAVERLPYLMGFTVSGRAAGEGMMNLPHVLSQLDSARCQTAVLELWTPPEAALDDTLAKERRWAERSLEYLRGLNRFD